MIGNVNCQERVGACNNLAMRVKEKLGRVVFGAPLHLGEYYLAHKARLAQKLRENRKAVPTFSPGLPRSGYPGEGCGQTCNPNVVASVLATNARNSVGVVGN